MTSNDHSMIASFLETRNILHGEALTPYGETRDFSLGRAMSYY